MKSLSLLIKPASGNCQLRCRYCFYKDVAESRQTADYGLMSLETLDQLVKKAIQEASEQCTFAFQGGEPTLIGLDFYRHLVAFQKKYKAEFQKKSLVVHNAIQTNGMLLDDEWCAFFAKNKFLVGLSLDGNKDIHDLNRIDATGKGTYNRVMKAARLLEKHKVEFNILIVVTRQLARRGKHVYHTLVKNGFRYLQFIPCIDDFDTEPGSSPHSLTADRYGEFLKDLFDEWYKDFMAGRYVSIRHFDNWIHMLQGFPPETCSMSGQCTCYGVVEANGSVFPCDFYVLDQWLLGSIQEDSFGAMLQGEQAMAFVAASLPVADLCRTCKYARICRGGCRRDREPLQRAPEQTPSLNIYCPAYLHFFDHAMGRMQQIARMTQR
jgi:uncharacterized protein